MACVAVSCVNSVIAETAFVTDECEIMLRRGQGTSFAILRQLKSGTPLQVLEHSDNGYTRVSAENGVSGWVLSRFLSSTPVARDQYESLKAQYDLLKKEFDSRLEARSQTLQDEIEHLKQVAKRPLDLQQENAELKQQISEKVDKIEQISQQNEVFKSPYKDRQWFILGVGTSLGSLLIGMVLTRIPWKRKKRWGDL